ncbi:methylmalonyl-CoA epimerase, mitochondrial [Strongylocentrotus purpuratus]|uniref:Methylmalonyl-CoA epimerase, mitochondrial n=1 Tax=Strongylocentrotus purpuratus TaxID=7668 RepID=A0A7M7N8Q5_STRPU|nr:methylmalonyl-CoA epimerase, mitochondrial [Strongylocentrotus purpuratus]
MAASMAKFLQKLGGGLGLVTRRYQSNNGVSNLWKLGKLNHVAIAVPDLEKAASMYRDVLGATVSETVPLPDHGVYTIFIELGNTKLELLHPLGDDSPIQGFLDKKPEGGMHHICIEVDNIEEAVKTVKENNIRPLGKKPRIGAHGKPVMFLHPKDCGGVLIELEEQ